MRRPTQSGFTVIELIIVVVVIGALAAVAVPAFIEYSRRSKTVEATMNVRKMYDSSVAYYAAKHTNAVGAPLPKQFPSPVGPAPANNACCGQPGDRCKPDASTFQDAAGVWAALNFRIDDPFYYSYQYLSAGVDTSASFQAYAYGNIDCDAVYSTFMRSGTVLPDGTVSGGSGLFSKNELE